MNKPTIEDRAASIQIQLLRENLSTVTNNLALAFEREDAYKAQIAELTAKNAELDAKPNPKPEVAP